MSEMLSTERIRAVHARSACLLSPEQVERALCEMATAIERDLHDDNPIVLCVLIGGVVLTGKLLTLVNFPLQVDYIHASRYDGAMVGEQLKWVVKPRASLKGRTVLIIDDILDHGITLAGIIDYCQAQGASQIKTAVLIEKAVQRPVHAVQKADYTGAVVEDRYVFGYGMDYKGYLRNVPGIFAVADEDK